MAQLKPLKSSRQASALADDLALEEDEAFLRPATAQRRARGPRRTASELVPNYDPAYEPAEDAEQFLRSRRRVAPRQGSRFRAMARSRFGRVLLAAAALALLVSAAMAVWAVRSFLQNDPHFRIDSSASIQATGITELSRTDLINVFGSDIGRNIFFVPLARREAALEAHPWVRHATVMRTLPDTLRVTIEERVPIAFVRVGRQIELADAEGVLLTMPPATLAARHYSFPVVVGLDPNALPKARADRMRLYASFVSQLDAGGTRVSSQLSEVDLADLDDVRAVVPAQGTDILLHFGSSDFLERYRSYQEHLPEWRQQYPNLSAVDLRYDRQVVLKMAEAAQADEAAEARPPVEPKPAPKTVAKPAARPATAHKGTAGPAHGVGAPAHSQAHSTAHGHAAVWYTQARSGPHQPARWVAHATAVAGRAQ